MLLADGLVVAVEEHAKRGIERHEAGLVRSSTKVSKNQVTCARCHLAGLASGIDWTWQSFGDSGATSSRHVWRMRR